MFKRINDEKPDVLNKITPVYGDITMPHFGLSEEHLEKVIASTNLFFHMAASLKLEATLKPNIEMNLLGTKHAIDLAKQMKQVKVIL